MAWLVDVSQRCEPREALLSLLPPNLVNRLCGARQVGPAPGDRSTLGKQLTGVCLVRVSVVSCFHLLSLWVSGVVLFAVVPWSPEESPNKSYGTQQVGAFAGLEVTGITRRS